MTSLESFIYNKVNCDLNKSMNYWSGVIDSDLHVTSGLSYCTCIHSSNNIFNLANIMYTNPVQGFNAYIIIYNHIFIKSNDFHAFILFCIFILSIMYIYTIFYCFYCNQNQCFNKCWESSIVFFIDYLTLINAVVISIWNKNVQVDRIIPTP